jgi:hypothetical protein
MADRVLRGSRLGAVSYETDRNHDLAPRQSMRYGCPRGHEFEVPFAGDAEAPATWECRLHGSISRLVDGAEPEQKKGDPHERAVVLRNGNALARLAVVHGFYLERPPSRAASVRTASVFGP